MNDETKSLRRRITAFQEDMLNVEILKTKEAFGYHYADLPNIIEVITPLLKRHGIGYVHYNSYHEVLAKNVVITEVFNVDNESDVIESHTLIDDKAVLAKMNRFMTEGSAITYFRRYHLTTILGLTTDEDSDAGGKRPTKQKPGRSVEASSEHEVDYVEIFKNIIANNPEDKGVKANKTLELYKKSISNEDIAKITRLIQEAYGK